jgi:hypothetical protein
LGFHEQEHDRKHLARADRHIAELKKDIARQWQIIEELSLGGHPLHEAISMLGLLKVHLRIMERHRQSILDETQDRRNARISPCVVGWRNSITVSHN